MSETREVKIFLSGNDSPTIHNLDTSKIDQVIDDFTFGEPITLSERGFTHIYNANRIDFILIEEVKEDE